jgi:hypothetical protein
LSRQEHAIALSRQERAVELQPLRTAIDDAIVALGWRRARPVCEAVLGVRCQGQRGGWWGKVGKRNGLVLLEHLANTPGQGKLF